MATQAPRPACCYWLTGLPAAGKSTLAGHLEAVFKDSDIPCCVLDGDVLRMGLNADLGFSATDRAESVRRASEVAALMVGAGLVTIVSLVSPYTADRRAARGRFAAGRFFEIYVQTDLQICIARDPKGLYRRALAGEIANFTGLTDAYEVPENPEMCIDTVAMPANEAAIHVAGAFGPLAGLSGSRR